MNVKPNSAKEYLPQRNEIIERVKSVLIAALNLKLKPNQIHPDEILFGAGLGLDSIDSLQLTVAIKSEFGVHINDEDMWSLRSINTLVDYIMIAKGFLSEPTQNKVNSYVINEDSFATYNLIRNAAVIRKSQNFIVLKITGETELAKLNSIVAKDIDFTPEGSVTHTLILGNDGSYISDIFFMNNFDHHFVLLPSHSAKELLQVISSAKINYEDITDTICMFSLDGCKAAEAIEAVFGPTASSLKPYMFSPESLGDMENILVARIDTYGEFGFLIIGKKIDQENILSHFNAIKMVNEIPQDTEQLLWLESCRFHKSICFNKNENIIEAGLAALVSFDKDEFRGKGAVSALLAGKHLIHFRAKSAIKTGENLSLDGENVGYVVACKYSPLLGQYIGNAYIAKSHAASGISYQASENANINSISAPQIIGQSYLDMI